MAVQGQWGIGGWKLPDFGWTEKLGIGTPNPNYVPQQQPSRSNLKTYNFELPQKQQISSNNSNNGQVLGINSKTVNNNPVNNNPVNNNPVNNDVRSFYETGVSNNQSQQDEANRILEEDFQNTMNYLGGQESGLRSDASYAEGQAEASGARQMTALGQEQATKEQGVQTQLSTAETGARTAMQQARDLFRQTQQSNIAQLSALGISSSSVAEALAERLGVETARRIAGVTGSLQEVRQNVTKELSAIKSYAAQRRTELEEWVANQKRQISSQMMSGINTLNYQRGVAATEKARGRAGILSQAQSNLQELTKQATQWQQQLDQFEKTQSAKYYQTAGDLGISLEKAGEILTQGTGISQTDLSRGVTVNNQGQMSGYIRYAPKENSDEPDFERFPNNGYTN